MTLIKNNIYWVGSLDFDIKTFDIVMHTDYGTTYNSYIVKGNEKIALVESVKDKFFDDHISKINEICNVDNIDYIIINHTEPDHTGSIKKILELNPNITVVGSSFALRFLEQITNFKFNTMVVKDGDELSLGDKTLKFISVPFLHWPDTIYTYAIEEEILFTCDSFGCHFASEKLFNDEITEDFSEPYKYYFDCIIGPFKDFMQKALDKISNINISTICTGHGPILRKDIDKYIQLYREWSTVEKYNDVVIAYVSSYGFTKEIAEHISKAMQKTPFNPILMDLETANQDEVLEKILHSKGLLVGSPTIADDALPPILNLLTNLNPNINKGLVTGVFGSYGWNGAGITNTETRLKSLRFKMPLDALKIQLKPSILELEQAEEFALNFTNYLQ